MTDTMSEFGFKTKIDSNGSIRDMPGETFLKVRDKLDRNPEDSDWRALARVVNGNYTVKPVQIEQWSPAINGQQSAAGCLLNYLSDRGMTVGELIKYLDNIHVDPFKLGLVDHVPVKIQRDIDSVEVFEGESLYLHVEATGHPYPQFQWFICKDGENTFTPLQGRNENVLKIDDMTSANRGSYACQMFNSSDPDETQISQIALVTVVPNPNPNTAFSDLRPPDEKTLAKMLANIGQCESSFPINADWKTRSTIQNCSLISRQPTSVNVAMNGSFLLTIETLASPPVLFQWFRNKDPLLGQVHSKLHVKHAMPEDFGEYCCIVRDGNRSEQSNSVSVTEKVLKLATEIVIVSSPKSLEVEYGGDVLFSCEARCPEPLKYQWFKDGQPLPGQDRAELKFINVQDRRCEGSYLCEISLLRGNDPMRCLTSSAQLRVKLPPGPPDNIKYNPSDKVALLIGNSDYRSEESLTAPSHDVRTLTQIFQRLHFKVVALLNLTQREIQNIVNFFCELIDRNVYVVFYFCGHGFERHGNTFLVPTDARAGYSLPECVCTEEILESIQAKDPALIFMILDLCRKGNSVQGAPLNKQFVWEKGNIVYCYATSIGQNAYEYKTNGLLVTHMAPLLPKPLGLDALISELKAEFSRFPNHSEKQIPHLSSNLMETGRKLTDLISYKGKTQAFQKRDLDWRNSLSTPPKKNVRFMESGVIVELDFQAEFSNVLNIFSTVVHPGNSYHCEPYIRNWPATVSLMGDIKVVKTAGGNLTKSTSILQDIQKLQDDLVVGVAIRYIVIIENQLLQKHEVVKVNLGCPLVSALKLWRQPDEAPSSGRQATEFDETES